MQHENIEFYRDLIEHLPEPILVQKGRRIMLVNKVTVTMLGARRADELVGRDFLDFIHPDNRAQVGNTAKNADLRQSRLDLLEQKMVRLDGSVFWADVRVFRRLIDGERGGFTVLRDVTVQRQTQESLRKAQEQLRDAIESVPNGFALWSADDRLVLCNGVFRSQYAELGIEVPDHVAYEALTRTFLTRTLKIGPAALDAVATHRVAEHRAATGQREVKLPDGCSLTTAERRTSDGGIVTIRSDITEFRRTEQALRKSEEQFRLLFEMAPHGIVMHRDGVVLHANPAAARIVKADGPADLIGTLISAFLPPEEAAAAVERVEDLIARQTAEAGIHEIKARCADGSEIVLEAKAAPFALPDGTAALVHFQDVTSRVRAREAVRRAQEQLRDAIDSMADGFALWDAEDRLVMFNEPYRKSFGAAEDVFVAGGKFDELMRAYIVRNEVYPPEEVDDRVARRIAMHRSPGERLEFTLPDGSVHQISERRTRDGGVVSIRSDITEIRRAERALRESEQVHRFLFDRSPYGIVVHRRGIYTHANEAAAKIMGGAPSDIIGRHVSTFLTPEAVAHSSARARKVLESGKGMSEPHELTLRRLDGREVIVDTIVGPFPSGGKGSVLVHFHDVTEQVRAREQKRLLEAQLRHAQKMESLGTLTQGIAHEFNNMLMPIIGLTELAIDSLPPEDATAAMLKQVVVAATRSRELVRRIQAFGRADRGVEGDKPLLMQDVIATTIDLVRSMMPASLRITYEANHACGPVAIGAGQLDQLLINLCSNASDAIGAKPGEIAIRVRPAHLDNARAAALQSLAPGDYVVLSVQDTGCGMDAATIGRIFDPFFTTKEVGKGTGLGLAVVHGMVAASGGAIALASQPGRGAEFSIYLPVVSAPADASLNRTAAAG